MAIVANATAAADEMGTLRAAYAGAKALAESTDKETKEAAAQLCARLAAQAGALGFSLESGDEPKPEKKPEEGGAAGAGGQQGELPKPEVGARAGATATAARGGAERPMTRAEFVELLAERDERSTLLTANADRIPKGHGNLVASMSLRDLRGYIGGLEPRPSANATAGAESGKVLGGADALTPEDKFYSERWSKRLGVSEANATAARTAMAADPEGGVDVDVFALVKAAKEKRGGARPA